MGIVERLRTEPPIYGRTSTTQMLREEAADEIEQLRAALKRCADRLERCAIAAGNNAETAALAVKEYRNLLETR